MKIVSADFITSATKPAHFPQNSRPEFAFFGRSNTGKSSLINMVVNRKNLVKVGSRPGMTQTVNFFDVNKKDGARSFVLVDLPGYGYAKRAKKTLQNIDTMLYDYCTARPQLAMMFFLMDIRRPPADVEKDIRNFFIAEDIPYTLVATKCDKLGKNDQYKARKKLADFFMHTPESIILSSSLKKNGRDEIHSILSECL